MIYSKELEEMCTVAKGVNHGPAPIPEEGKWVKAKEIKDISGLTHGIGWCAPQQGACKLTLNVKDGIIQEALIETIGCSGMTHSAAMAGEILTGKTLLEALNTDLSCGQNSLSFSSSYISSIRSSFLDFVGASFSKLTKFLLGAVYIDSSYISFLILEFSSLSI